MGIAEEEKQKLSRSRKIAEEAAWEGCKNAAIACFATAIPTLAAVRFIPWAKANINYTGQALIISSASIATYFITADKSINKRAARNRHYEKSI